MTIVQVFRDANGRSWSNALQRLFIIAIVSLLPFLLGWVFLSCFRLPADFFSFIKHGEAGIATIGVVLSASFVISKELSRPFAHRRACFLTAIILTALASLIYSAAAVSMRVVQLSIGNAGFVAWSIGTWVGAVLFGFLIELIDSVREQGVDPQQKKEEQFKELEQAFEESKNG